MAWSLKNITGGVSSFLNDPLRTTKENPEAAALVAAGIAVGTGYVDPTLMFGATTSGTATTATADSLYALTAPTGSGLGLSSTGSLGLQATQAQVLGSASTLGTTGVASSGLTFGSVLSGVNTGINALGAATKLSLLGKSMDAQTATANGLTGALAASPIQTPSGLITTTPQGAVMTGAQAASGGFMGMDNQTLFVIAVGIAAVYYFSKHGK